LSFTRLYFDQILNTEHALLQLARKIDWARFDTAFANSYCDDMSAPAKAIRLMVGLHYLKYTFNEPKMVDPLKSDHRMNRCFLAGLNGDVINAVLATGGGKYAQTAPAVPLCADTLAGGHCDPYSNSKLRPCVRYMRPMRMPSIRSPQPAGRPRWPCDCGEGCFRDDCLVIHDGFALGDGVEELLSVAGGFDPGIEDDDPAVIGS